MTSDELYKKAKLAIRDIFDDDSAGSTQDALDSLRGLRDIIDNYIDMLERLE